MIEESFTFTGHELFQLAGAISAIFMAENPQQVMPTEQLIDVVEGFIAKTYDEQ